MNRRMMMMALLAQTGALKPTDRRLMKQKQSPMVRPWSVSKTVIDHFNLKPANSGSVTVGVTLVGEDGQRYLLDDVIYAILHVLEIDLNLKPE